MNKTCGRCASIELNPARPGASLLAARYARELYDAGVIQWVMVRAGYVQGSADPIMSGVPLIPPSGSTTSRVLFIGQPIEAIEMASSAKRDGLGVDLLVTGISEESPPVSTGMLKNIGAVMAPREAHRWLVRNRVDCAALIQLPVGGKLRGPDESESRADPNMHVVWEGRSTVALRRAPFAALYRSLFWRADGVLASTEYIHELAAWADVYVRHTQETLDDPIEAAFRRAGVITVAADPVSDLPARLVQAAQLRRAGVGGRVAPDVGERAVEVLGRFDGTSGASGRDAVVVSAPALVQLGVVIPFGGLPVEGLERMLENLCEAKPDGVPVVIAYQQVSKAERTVEQRREREQVEQLAARFGATLAPHGVPSGWRLGTARNTGVSQLPSGVTHVVFLDADILPDLRYFYELQEELEQFPDRILSPYVLNENGSVRIGSGVSVIPIECLIAVQGFRQDFEGWGFEDLDLLSRVRRRCGVGAAPWGSPASPMLRHLDHDLRWQETANSNWARYQGSDARNET